MLSQNKTKSQKDSFYKKIGKMGENLTRRFLKGKGFQYIGSNIYVKTGEIDLVFRDHLGKWLFIEVKTWYRDQPGADGWVIGDRVSSKKRRKLMLCAAAYLYSSQGRSRADDDREWVSAGYSIYIADVHIWSKDRFSISFFKLE